MDDWKKHYAYVAGDASQPSSATIVAVHAEPAAIWAASTSDGRALRKAEHGSGRIVAAWYGSPGIDIAASASVGAQVALY